MRPPNALRVVVLIVVTSFAAAFFAAEEAQSPLEAALELFFAPDIQTVESFLLKSTREQLRQLDSDIRGEVLGAFNPGSRLEKGGFKIERLENRPDLFRMQNTDSKETVTVTLEKQQVEKDRAVLQVVARGKDFLELRVVIRMQSEEGRWRLAGVANSASTRPSPLERLDDPDLATKIVEQLRMAYEASALAFLRAYYAALELYYMDHAVYPETMAALASGPGPIPLIDERLASGKVSGYVFIYKLRSPSSYTLEARPEVPGETGNRFFFMDQTGTIHYEEGKPAGPESPLLTQP